MDEPKGQIRVELLRECADVVAKRGETYGPPHEHFSRTVGLINVLFADKLREPLIPSDWAQFMILDKLAREQEVTKRDNAMDIAGYAGCMHECRMHQGART